MVGLDTSVLVRILIDDGSPNVAIARRFAVEQVARGERLFVDRIVLAEAERVLGTVYGYAPDQIRVALGAVLSNGAYEIGDRATVVAAWEKYGNGGAGFSDCLIAATHAAAGCGFTATFDKGMRGLPTTRVLR